MARPKVAVEKQHKVISVSLSPEALAHIAAFQARYIKAHHHRITRSQAVETLILRSSLGQELGEDAPRHG